MNVFIVRTQPLLTLEMNTLVLETNTSVLETNTFKHTFELQPHTCTASYQQLQNRPYLCRDDYYSQVLTSKNRWYHALILTFMYATPTSDIYTIALSAGLNGLQVD